MQVRRKERLCDNPGGLPPYLGKLGSLLFFVAMFVLAEPNQNGYAQFRKCHGNCVNGLLHAIGMPPAVAGVFLIIRSVSDCATFTRYLQGSILTVILVLYLRYEAHPLTPWLDAPISDPEIVLVVCVDDPQGIDYYGGLVAAPVFAKMMEGAIRYRDVVPDAIDAAKPPAELMIDRSGSATASHQSVGVQP